ncbi:hypothetical protein OPFAMLBM_00349 [Aeromonas phage avDM12-TAAL]|nr:hypothetical protein OPFAMLBM_00349 [Aeromonas phage avDM12-TAAL]
MKILITDVDKARINRAKADAMKLLGVFEAKDRVNAMAIIDYMTKQWTMAIRQSNTTVNLQLADQRGLSDETIHEIAMLQAYRERHLQSIENDYRTLEHYAPSTEKALIRESNDKYLAEKLAWIRHIEFQLQEKWGFELNASHHVYNVPHCTCPKHRAGDPFYRTDRNCPMHNSRMNALVKTFFEKIEKSYCIPMLD